MNKNYFYSVILFFCFISVITFAQDKQIKTQDTTIEGLNLYPNPVSNSKVFITSKSGQDKPSPPSRFPPPLNVFAAYLPPLQSLLKRPA